MKASMAGDPGGELVVSMATRGTFRACCASARPVAAATNRPAMRSRRLICPPCRMVRRNWGVSDEGVRGEVCQRSQHLALSRYPPAVCPSWVKLRRTQCEQMFSALHLKLGHCWKQSACLKRATSGHPDLLQIKPEGRSKLSVIHAREIVPGINVPCSAEEELVERLHSSRAQRISDASRGDLCKKPLRARNGNKLEVVREYPCPVGNEVIPCEGYVRITAGDHLRKIAMHNAEATS